MSMSMLEKLGLQTQGLTKTVKPFESWEGSPVQKWPVELTMMTIGDLAEIAQMTANSTPIEATYRSKIYLLAKSIQSINGHPLVSPEVIEEYNKDHNLTGTQKVDMFRYKVLFISKWTEAIVNRLSFAYDELQDEYLSKHLGRTLPDEMKAASVSGIDLSQVHSPQNEDKSDVINNSGDSSST